MLVDHGFQPSKDDISLCHMCKGQAIVFCLIYVDDLLVLSNDPGAEKDLLRFLQS